VDDSDLSAVVTKLRGRRSAGSTASTSVPDFTATPAEVGYGHGV
jgi:hypothetical protein